LKGEEGGIDESECIISILRGKFAGIWYYWKYKIVVISRILMVANRAVTVIKKLGAVCKTALFLTGTLHRSFRGVVMMPQLNWRCNKSINQQQKERYKLTISFI